MKFRKLRYINLAANLEQDLIIDTNKFSFNARFLCNYLSKEVRKLNIAGDGTYNMISVVLSTNHSDCRLRYGTDYLDVLSVSLHISDDEQREYNAMTDLNDRYEFYLQQLEKGYLYASKFKKVPIAELIKLHEQFRINDYKNEWLWKKRLIRDYGLYIFFKCYFTTFEFRLELEAYDIHKTALLTKGVVFRTGPDEIFFDKDFRKLEIQNGKLMILDFLDKPNFEIDLATLAKGIFNVRPIEYSRNDGYKNLIESITW